MSDLISTPSQTQSQVSSEAFEALVDLLASDGIDQTPSNLAGTHTRAQANTTLRDPSGKLDFDKIRMMFAVQNNSLHVTNGQEKNCVLSPTLPPHVEEGDSDDEPHSPRSVSPTVLHSMSPKPVQRPSVGHRRSSTFGNQPGVAIHENAAKVEDVALSLSCRPLSFNELNAALAGAHEEVRSLRQQYDELRALVARRLGTEIRDQVKPSPSAVNTEKVAPDREEERDETPDSGRKGQPGASILPPPPPPPDVPSEIASLSENEAKRALSVLARSLNLSPSALASLSTLSPQQSMHPVPPTREYDVASIARALKFLGTVDELVWRRTSAPSGPRTLLPVFSEENLVALMARLELWERAVRRSPRV